ncbi:MAG: hypothetical protein KF847_19410 [Pirellulales bacterium]|nr:hypothetical protein [Pirellulales bacterium]
MKLLRTCLAILAVCVLATPRAEATLSYSTVLSTYSQDFNSLASTGTPTWTNNSTLSGWYLFNSAGATPPTYATGTGSGTAGSFYSFGTSGNDRALGGLGSGGTYFGSPATGAVAGYIAVGLTNDTSATLFSFTVGFDGEQWRNGGNATAQPMVLQYGIGSTFAGVTTWTTPGGTFDWTSPVATATAAAVDGNAAGLVANRGGTINDIKWKVGETLWIRWIELNDAGNDHGLAIDNFSFSAVPEASSFVFLGMIASGGLATYFRRRRA